MPTNGPELPPDHTGPLVITEIEGRGLMVGYCYNPDFLDSADDANQIMSSTMISALANSGVEARYDEPLIIAYAGQDHANLFIYYPVVDINNSLIRIGDLDSINSRMIDNFYRRPGAFLLANSLLRDPN